MDNITMVERPKVATKAARVPAGQGFRIGNITYLRVNGGYLWVPNSKFNDSDGEVPSFHPEGGHNTIGSAEVDAVYNVDITFREI